jgi:hypothetical protein
MRNTMYAPWSAGNCFEATLQDEEEDRTSCPAIRKINRFPGKTNKTLSNNAE